MSSDGGRGDAAKCIALLAALILSTLAAAGLLTSTLAKHGDQIQFADDDPAAGNVKEAPPQPKQPWRIFHVHWATALTFDCAAGDVPAIHVVPSDPALRATTNNDVPPATTCAGRTLKAYKLGDGEEDPAALHVLFPARPCDGEEKARGLVPAPKAELRILHKLLATIRDETAWNPRGMFVPEYLPFSDDTVVVYCPSIRALMVIGRDDVEFRQALVGADVKIRALAPGTVI